MKIKRFAKKYDFTKHGKKNLKGYGGKNGQAMCGMRKRD